MKRNTIMSIILSAVAFLVGCQRRLPQSDPSVGSARLTLRFTAPQMEIATRSGENTIRDINLFCYHHPSGTMRRFYLYDGNPFTVPLPLGEYTVYAIANVGAGINAHTVEELEALSFEIPSEADLSERMILSSKTDVEIVQGGTLDIVLERCYAKVDVQLSTAVGFDFELHSVSLYDCPEKMAPFRRNEAGYLAYSTAQRFTGDCSFYLAENLKGENPGITHQRQKGRANAPRYASHLLITGKSGDRYVDYFVFLGENPVSNFDVRRNRHYRYNITLINDNEIDTRISVSELAITDFAEQTPVMEMATGTLELSCSNNTDNAFDMEYRILQGSGTVLIDGRSYLPGIPFRFMEAGTNRRSARIEYAQADPDPAVIEFRSIDRTGNQMIRTMQTEFIIPRPVISRRHDSYQQVQGPCLTPLRYSINEPGNRYWTLERLEGTANEQNGHYSGYFDYNSPAMVHIFPEKVGRNRFRFTLFNSPGGEPLASVTDTIDYERLDINLRAYCESYYSLNPAIFVDSDVPVLNDVHFSVWVDVTYVGYSGGYSAGVSRRIDGVIPEGRMFVHIDTEQIMPPEAEYAGYTILPGSPPKLLDVSPETGWNNLVRYVKK